jgi:CubicO group peptidase (beta-lactamase class C family)
MLSVPPLAIQIDQFLELVGSRGLLVWHDGKVVHESYRRGHTASVRWMMNSATKLNVAMLIAIAQASGVLGANDTPLMTYWPELKGTSWEPVTIGQCLDMSTGVDFQEESLDLESDSHYAHVLKELACGSIDSYLLTLGRRAPAGSEVIYSSADTEMLGRTLARAAGKSLSALLEEYVWKPAGMESDAYWICDQADREMALAGICATLRDYARLGILLFNDGRANSIQVLPEDFVRRLAHPPAELFSMAGHDEYPLVCFNQVFVPNRLDEQRGDYMGAGSFGQVIYVNPERKTVIAHHGIFADITTEYIDIHRLFMAFRQISDQVAST